MTILDQLSELEDTYQRALWAILNQVTTLDEVGSVADHLANMAGGPISLLPRHINQKLAPLIDHLIGTESGWRHPAEDAALYTTHVLNLLSAAETFGGYVVGMTGDLAKAGLDLPGSALPGAQDTHGGGVGAGHPPGLEIDPADLAQ